MIWVIIDNVESNLFFLCRVQCKDGFSETVFLLSGNDQCIHLYKEVSVSLFNVGFFKFGSSVVQLLVGSDL